MELVYFKFSGAAGGSFLFFFYILFPLSASLGYYPFLCLFFYSFLIHTLHACICLKLFSLFFFLLLLLLLSWWFFIIVLFFFKSLEIFCFLSWVSIWGPNGAYFIYRFPTPYLLFPLSLPFYVFISVAFLPISTSVRETGVFGFYFDSVPPSFSLSFIFC